MPPQSNIFKIVSLVEATTINAVAKNVLAFHRSVSALREFSAEAPEVQGLIVTFERPNGEAASETHFVKAARAAGLEVASIPERRRFDLSLIPVLRRVVKESGPHVIVSHAVKSHFLIWRSRLEQEFAWAAFHHGYTAPDRKMRFYNRLDRWSLRSATGLITVCDAFARELSKTTSVPVNNIFVQHNSIEIKSPASADDVKWLRERFGIAAHEKIILAVGRLSREKAHLDLLKAFKLFRHAHAEMQTRLVIVGEGPDREKLETAAADLGLMQHVIFTGHTNNTHTFYSAADVFVLPSLSEGSSNVLLEAMAAGVPVVATRVGGTPEIVSHQQSAWLVPPRDPAALAVGIERVLADQELAHRLSRNATALISNRFTPEIYAREMLRIYRSIAMRTTGC